MVIIELKCFCRLRIFLETGSRVKTLVSIYTCIYLQDLLSIKKAYNQTDYYYSVFMKDIPDVFSVAFFVLCVYMYSVITVCCRLAF